VPRPATESLPEPPELVETVESSPQEHEVAQGRTPTPPVTADPREPALATSQITMMRHHDASIPRRQA
jgi:hypothetical protein